MPLSATSFPEIPWWAGTQTKAMRVLHSCRNSCNKTLILMIEGVEIAWRAKRESKTLLEEVTWDKGKGFVEIMKCRKYRNDLAVIRRRSETNLNQGRSVGKRIEVSSTTSVRKFGTIRVNNRRIRVPHTLQVLLSKGLIVYRREDEHRPTME